MGSKSTSTQRMDPWEPAQPMLKQGIQDAQSLYNSGGFQQNPYAGQMVANYDPMRAQADSALPGIFGGAMNNFGAASNTLTQAMDPNARSGAWQQVKQNAINDIMPAINGSFAGSGMTGSTLHQQNLAKGLSAGLAGVEDAAWQQGQNRALSAASMVPSINNAAFGAADALRAAGTDRQAYDQAGINANIIRDQQAQAAPLQALQDYMAMVSGAGSVFGTQTATQRQSPGLFGILGAGLQGLGSIATAGGFPAIFSDRRLKKDIKKVGKTDEGLGVYTYRYKAGGPIQMGVMAQEVEKVRPGAVKTVAGFKAVDYGAL